MKKMKIAGLVVLVLLSVYLWRENRDLDKTFYRVKDSRIQKKIKICHLSDFHNRGDKKFQERLLNFIEEEKPDYIFLTGDLVDSRRTRPQLTLDFLRDLVDLAPCYYVTGNHEHRIQGLEGLHRAYKNLGIHILGRDPVFLEGGLEVHGLQDPRSLGPGLSMKDMEAYYRKNLQERAFSKEAYHILLVHRPDFLDLFSSYPFDLIFAGHFHGGQIRLPILGPLLSPNGKFFPENGEGLVEKKGTKEIISRGLGNSSFPLRVHNKPEVLMVTLEGDGNSSKET